MDQENKTREDINEMKKEAQEYVKLMKSFKQGIKSREQDVYAIDLNWLNQWKKYVDLIYYKRKEQFKREYIANNSKPTIDSGTIWSDIRNDYMKAQELDQFLKKNRSLLIKLIPKAVYDLFHKNYSLLKGIEIKKEKDIDASSCMDRLELNFYLLPSIQTFTCQIPVDTKLLKFTCYSYENVSSLFAFIKSNDELKQKINNLKNSDLSLWKYQAKCEEQNKYTRKNIPQNTLVKDLINTHDGNIVCEYSNDIYCETNEALKEISQGLKGKVGLNNIGNTCYMASGLQCLSNCNHLTEYFLKYYDDSKINRSNEDGTQGALTNAYKDVLFNLWKMSSSSFSPSKFKYEISSFNSLFSGSYQQDSFELLSYTLNAIHEDINLIIKPITSRMSLPNTEEDADLVKYKWDRYHRRKQSVIIDLFYGMYKSAIYCPNGCVIKVFETFHAFQLPLNVYYITCIFIYYDLKIRPVEIKIPFETDKLFGHLRKLVSTLFDVKEDSFIFADVEYNRTIKQFYSSEKNVERNSTVYCFQINPEITEDSFVAGSFTKKSDDMIEAIMKQTFPPVEYKEQKLPFFETINKSKLGIKIDNNYNLDSKYIKLLLNIHLKQDYTPIQRVLFIDKTLKVSELYQEIEKYLLPLTPKVSLTSSSLLTNDSDYFGSDISITFTFKPIFNEGRCIFCDQSDCEGCAITKKNFLQVSHFFRKIGPYSANSYLFIPYNDRSNFKQNFNSFEINVVYNYNVDQMNLLNDPKRRNLPNDGDNSYHLEYCIKQFHTVQNLNGQWRCSKCQNYVQARKGMYVYSTSHYLIIQMKRFKENMSGKFDHLINFPVHGLDLSPYVVDHDKSSIYDLIGVINHYGSFYGGHYTAYAKNCIDNQWREFNDRSVSLLSESDIVTSSAYVLFYKKRNVEKEFNKEELFSKHPI